VVSVELKTVRRRQRGCGAVGTLISKERRGVYGNLYYQGQEPTRSKKFAKISKKIQKWGLDRVLEKERKDKRSEMENTGGGL